jgi:type II secretory pathway pseudopilin PulG
MKKRKGFNLLELTVFAAAVIAILLIAVPKLTGTVKSTKNDVDFEQASQIATAIHQYHYEIKSYPPSLNALITKSGNFGPWLSKIPNTKWGGAFFYTYTSNSFAVWSTGQNLADETGATNALAEKFKGDDIGVSSK